MTFDPKKVPDRPSAPLVGVVVFFLAFAAVLALLLVGYLVDAR